MSSHSQRDSRLPIENVTAPLEWLSGEATEAHKYLLPVVSRELALVCPTGGAKVLDLGCGNGYATAAIGSLGYDVLGMDVSEPGIAIARKLHPAIRFDVGSIYDDNLYAKVDAPVDVIVALEVIEHLYFPNKLFEISRHLLTDGGHLIVSTPYHGYLKNLAISLAGGWDRHFGVADTGGHIKFFSEKTVSQMAAAAGFRRRGFCGVGRIPWLWKSMVASFIKRDAQ